MWMQKSGVRLKRMSVCIVSALLLCGCGRQEEPEDVVVIEQEDSGGSYEFALAEIGDVVKTKKITCKYRQVQEQEVKFPLGGRIVDQVYVEEGDTVKKGQLLAELSSQDLKRRIEDLEYRIAKNELLLEYVDANEEIKISGFWVNYLYGYGGSEEELNKRIEALQQNSRYQREDYSDALAADREELEQLEKDYRDSRIYAAMDGVIYDMKDFPVGSTSQLGETIMTVMDTSESLFEAKEPEMAQYFHEGETVSMTISFGNGAGQYLLLPYRMDEWGDTQLFEVYDGPEERATEVGTSGTITVVEDSRQNVLTLPVGAIKNAGEKHYVYVLGEGDVREARWVETGLFGDSLVEILSGLAEGEKVILK
ncbi:MAG: efflux RND transporter periplasmic adaptor subunit [Lachnospiraceae bacterium]|nr:efflux RND transporter periplasmic adaptor subunit [Lachnospiraceae bacterium]